MFLALGRGDHTGKVNSVLTHFVCQVVLAKKGLGKEFCSVFKVVTSSVNKEGGGWGGNGCICLFYSYVLYHYSTVFSRGAR